MLTLNTAAEEVKGLGDSQVLLQQHHASVAAYFVEEPAKFEPGAFYAQLSSFIHELIRAANDLKTDASLLLVPKDHSFHTPEGTHADVC
jgi:hypothetical protein